MKRIFLLMGWGRRPFFKTLVFFLFIFISCGKLLAVTAYKKNVECPICGTSNEFIGIGSWGSYVYEKYPLQLVNWPETQSFPIYMCKNCNYTAFMWDFEKLPKEKYQEVKNILNQMKSKEKFEDYRDVPMSRRVEIAEKVYSILNKNDDFWSWFYRVKGYFYDREKQDEKAHFARKKALLFINKLLSKKENAGIQKELLLTSGAMKHFLNDDKSALLDFKNALKLRFRIEDASAEWNERHDNYYTNFLIEYIKILLQSEKEQKSLKWYYEMGTCYFLKTFKMGPVILLYSFLMWILLFILFFLIDRSLELMQAKFSKQVYFHYVLGAAILFLIFSGSYLFVKTFGLSDSIVPAVVIGIIWLGLTIIFEGIIKRKNRDNRELVHYFKNIFRSKIWKPTRILILFSPLLMALTLSHIKNPTAMIKDIETFNKKFTELFHIGLSILSNSIGVWVLLCTGIFILYRVLKALPGRLKNSVLSDYIFNILSICLIFLGTEIYLSSYNKHFPTSTFVLIGILWFLLSTGFEFAMIHKLKSKRQWLYDFQKLFKTRLWYIVRITTLISPIVLGLSFYWIQF